MEPFVAFKEAGAFLDVKVSWISEQIRLDRVPSYKVDAFCRLKLSELEAWARENQTLASR